MRYRTVLFDLDHTLFDSDTSLRMAFDHTLASAGRTDPDDHVDAFDRLNRRLWQQVEAGTMTPPEVHQERFRLLNERLDVDVTPEAMAATYAAALGDHGELYPGALGLLDRLGAAGVTLALVTNGLSEVQRARIERLGIGARFDTVVISAEVGMAKPATEIFDLTFERLGDPDRSAALMVGDNPSSDIKGGADADVATCWYNPHRRAATAGIDATHEVTELTGVWDVVAG